MARFYLSGRTRLLRAYNTVAVMATTKQAASAASGAIGAPSAYSLVSISNQELFWRGFAYGFGILPAIGQRAITGGVQTVLGFRVPSISGNGFIPIAECTGPGQTIRATITIIRNVELIERFAHTQNGQRLDAFGAAGTCYETYAGEGQSYTSKDDSFGFVPGQSPAALTSFGITASVAAYTENGYASGIPWTVGDHTCTWDWKLVDPDGNALFGDPSFPSGSSNAGSSGWGAVVASGPPLPGGPPMVPASLKKRNVGVSFSFVPRYGLEVQIAPLAIPDASPLVRSHRLETWRFDPTNNTTSASGTNFDTSGETVNLACGGSAVTTTHSPKDFKPLLGVYQEDSTAFVRSYKDFLPLVTKLQVTSGEAEPHFFAHVRAPWDALQIEQASAVTVPGGAGLDVAVGTPETLALGAEVGYRYLRVSAKTPTGTGTLTIKTYLNGNTTTHTASKTLTTTVADTPVSVTIDMLEVAGCTYDSRLELEQLVFTAAGSDFEIVTVELVRTEALLQSLGSCRSLFPLAMPSVQPWLYGFTDGVLSLSHAITGSTDGLITLSSITLGQLVAEINGTSRPAIPSGWSPPFPFAHTLGSAAPTPSAYLGWVATDLAPPRALKGYGADEIYEAGDWSDSDVYLPALHGDGIIGSQLCLTNTGTTLQAQRFSSIIEPGIMPGDAGFDGTDGSAFGEDATAIHTTTRVRFVGLFSGAAQGMEVGPLVSLPIKETEVIIPSGGTTPITPPVAVGSLVPRGSGFALSSAPLRGERGNGYIQSTIYNDGGTPTDAQIAPYTRQRVYGRWWTDGVNPCALEHDAPRGWLHIAQELAVHTYWREGQTSAGLLVEGFSGEDLSLTTIHRMQTITGGRLVILGASGSGYKLLLSGDGGKTATEILTMADADSALVGYDGVRNWLVAWWEDSATHHVKRRVSRDGGASWEASQDVQWTLTGGSLEDLEAELLDVKFVRELAGRFVMVVKENGASNGSVIQSGDGGLTWSQVL